MGHGRREGGEREEEEADEVEERNLHRHENRACLMGGTKHDSSSTRQDLQNSSQTSMCIFVLFDAKALGTGQQTDSPR